MEDKLLRIFARLFTIICITFPILLIYQLYNFIRYGITWIPWYHFLWVLLTPLVGLAMMTIGEYIDNKKKQ
jgi:hypothetical protein